MASLKLLVFAGMAGTAYGAKSDVVFEQVNFFSDNEDPLKEIAKTLEELSSEDLEEQRVKEEVTSALTGVPGFQLLEKCKEEVNVIKVWTSGLEGGCPKPRTATNKAPLGNELKRSVLNARDKMINAETRFWQEMNLLTSKAKQLKWAKKWLKNFVRKFKNEKYSVKKAGRDGKGVKDLGACKDETRNVAFELRAKDVLLKDCEKLFKQFRSVYKGVYQDDYDSSCWTMIIISAVVVFAVLIAVIMMFCKSSNAED